MAGLTDARDHIQVFTWASGVKLRLSGECFAHQTISPSPDHLPYRDLVLSRDGTSLGPTPAVPVTGTTTYRSSTHGTALGLGIWASERVKVCDSRSIRQFLLRLLSAVP